MSAGAFVWYDLATSDPVAAAAFYAGVVGWTPIPVPGMVADEPYTMFKMGSAILAGMHHMPSEVAALGVPPHWSGHVQVDDVDAMLERVLAAGGACKFGPGEVPAVGRFAVVTDPQGAHFYLFAPSYTDVEPPAMSPGSMGWTELHTPDPAAALAFYAGLFGWTGDRQMFAYGGTERGAIVAAPAGMAPHWLFHIAVEGIDGARDRVEAGGGQVLQGPQAGPGGTWTLVCRDPQGGAFALVAPRR